MIVTRQTGSPNCLAPCIEPCGRWGIDRVDQTLRDRLAGVSLNVVRDSLKTATQHLGETAFGGGWDCHEQTSLQDSPNLVRNLTKTAGSRPAELRGDDATAVL